MESLEALQPLCLDAHFMAIIMTFLIGQHVQLDIILPPFGGRPPSASTERPHPQASLVMDYLNQFQGCWPMPVTGIAVDRFGIRLTFCHLLFAPLARLGSVVLDGNVPAPSATASAYHIASTTRATQSLRSSGFYCVARLRE